MGSFRQTYQQRVVNCGETYLAANRKNSKASRDRRMVIINQAKSVPCMDCKQTFDSVCMDFDHRPGETKLGLVPHMKTFSLGKLQAEIAKCDVVCSNCHRLRTKARKSQVSPDTGLKPKD